MRKTPKRGDILMITLNPVAGSEMQGAFRPVLVLSNEAFNQLGTTLVAPITQGGNYARVAGFAISLMGAGIKTQGVVVVSQCKMLDVKARGAKFVETAPRELVAEVLARLQAIVE